MSQKILIIMTVIGALLLAYVVVQDLNKKQIPKSVVNSSEVKSTGAASIGGNFELIDSNNKIVKDTDFQGKMMLVFFGFTYCPEICPMGLNTMSLVAEDINNIAYIFITVDPERDTPEQLKDYMESYHTSINALTGSKEKIDEVVEIYKVYSKKRTDIEEVESYTMDHSAYIYLMDKEGRYIQHFRHNDSPDKIIAAIRGHL